MKMFQAIIKAKTVAQMRALQKRGIDISEHSAGRDEKDFLYKVDAIITKNDKQILEAEGYIVDIISDLSDIARARLKEVSRTNRFSEVVKTTAELEAFTVPGGGYMNVDAIEEELKAHNKVYPDLVELIELPNKTWEGKVSRAIRIHVGTRTDKPAVLFIGGVHAREWGTSDICMHFIRNLLVYYKFNSPLKYGNKIFTPEQIKTIVENIDIIVFPDVNPDGKAFSQQANNPEDPNTDEVESVWWRKNRNPNPVPYPSPEDREIHKAAGVDLNRNFDYLWYSGIGTTNEDGTDRSIIYKGSQPFSEPESKNVKHLFDTYKNIKCFVDIHCHVGKILMSWGDDDTQSFYPDQNYRNSKYHGKRGKREILSDESEPEIYSEYMHPLDLYALVNYATRMSNALTAVRGREYKTEPSVGLYPTSGSSQDYAFSQRVPGDENRSRIFAYTIEFGASSDDRESSENTFIPEYDPVMRNIMDDVASALTELCFAVASEKNSQ
jgi:carboxypeptidase T